MGNRQCNYAYLIAQLFFYFFYRFFYKQCLYRLMRKVEYVENLKKIIKVKKYLDQSLYNGHSLVTYDLLLRILESNLKQRPTTIKEVCTQSTQSMLNTRKHLNHLIMDGWVELAQDTQDKRQRLLKPTDKLKKMINELGKNFFD